MSIRTDSVSSSSLSSITIESVGDKPLIKNQEIREKISDQFNQLKSNISKWRELNQEKEILAEKISFPINLKELADSKKALDELSKLKNQLIIENAEPYKCKLNIGSYDLYYYNVYMEKFKQNESQINKIDKLIEKIKKIKFLYHQQNSSENILELLDEKIQEFREEKIHKFYEDYNKSIKQKYLETLEKNLNLLIDIKKNLKNNFKDFSKSKQTVKFALDDVPEEIKNVRKSTRELEMSFLYEKYKQKIQEISETLKTIENLRSSLDDLGKILSKNI
ncbi:MAG: hypothetical protein Tsb0021_15970 [Chlamydiales bacterium]